MTLLLFTLFFSSKAAATASFSLRLKTVMQASSPAAMERRLAEIGENERNVRLCQAELRGEQVPVHCLKLSADTLEKSGLNFKKALVSRLCKQAVARLETVSEIHTRLSSLQVDKDCFEAAKQRKLRLEYMHPELMIESDSSGSL